MDWSSFTLRDGKQVIVAPCVDVVAFSFDPPDAAGGKGFDRAVRTFVDRYGGKLAFYRTGDMKRFRRVESGRSTRHITGSPIPRSSRRRCWRSSRMPVRSSGAPCRLAVHPRHVRGGRA